MATSTLASQAASSTAERRPGVVPASQRDFYRMTIVALLVVAAFCVCTTTLKSAELCPATYQFEGGVCIEPITGDIVKPETAGDALRRFAGAGPDGALCAAWDLHIAQSISEFEEARTLPAAILVNAGMMRSFARELCQEGRYREAVQVYRTIFRTSAPADAPSCAGGRTDDEAGRPFSTAAERSRP
jgi:hypothetical protein